MDARTLADLAADLLIIGGGIAGLCAALEAPPTARIIVVDKGEAGAGSSPLAQGGMAAAVGPLDNPQFHAEDTIAAGAGLCDQAVVHDFCAQGPSVVAWLESLGVVFDRDDTGQLDLAHEGAQRVPRSVHWIDATGAEFVRGLRAAVAGKTVTRISARADRLLLQNGRVVGAEAAGQRIFAPSTLIATGGAGGLWGATTNAAGATADGGVLGMLAGAQLADLELMQFHPTALAVGGATTRVLLTEALRGEGATLIDSNGERFVDELGPRSVVSRAIMERAPVRLDARSVPDLQTRYPNVLAEVRARGFDMATEPVPVEPAAHYFIGGLAADAEGRTSIPGMFAAGEASSTGFHGANRMAGNSLLEAVVVGRRVGAQVAHAADIVAVHDRETRAVTDPDLMIREILASSAGMLRDLEQLVLGRKALDQLSVADDGLPLPHAMFAGMILRAAQSRAESRGVHLRADYPELDDAFAVRTFDQLP